MATSGATDAANFRPSYSLWSGDFSYQNSVPFYVKQQLQGAGHIDPPPPVVLTSKKPSGGRDKVSVGFFSAKSIIGTSVTKSNFYYCKIYI